MAHKAGFGALNEIVVTPLKGVLDQLLGQQIFGVSTLRMSFDKTVCTPYKANLAGQTFTGQLPSVGEGKGLNLWHSPPPLYFRMRHGE